MDFSQKVIYRLHAVRRMFQRNIGEENVRSILANGKIIEEYLDDEPYPSFLILGWIDKRPLHIVAAKNKKDEETIIITVYEPHLSDWLPNFQERKK